MFFLLIFFFGLAIGSFLNVLILRIPKGQSIRGRSKCVACQNTLRWFELVPLFSYVAFCGKCRSCRAGIALQYPLVECATGLLFLATYYFSIQHSAFSIVILLRDWFFIAVLIILFVQDLRFQILPDIVTLPAIAIAEIIGR